MSIDANRVIQIIGVIVVALQGYTASQMPGIEIGQQRIEASQESTRKEILVELGQHQAELLEKIMENQVTVMSKVALGIEDIDKQVKDYKEKHP